MEDNLVEKILELNRKIDDIIAKATLYFEFKKERKLNDYDRQIVEYYQEILNLIIQIADKEKTSKIKIIDDKYFKVENTASMMIESYMSVLQFYGDIDRSMIKQEIEVINQIRGKLKLSDELEIENEVELANCYFRMGDENKARKVMLEFIKNNPDEDEAYMCMQNWYMYDKPDIDKLAAVIDLAERNKHILITDFGYAELVKVYGSIGDIKSKEKYQRLYDRWKNNRTTI